MNIRKTIPRDQAWGLFGIGFLLGLIAAGSIIVIIFTIRRGI